MLPTTIHHVKSKGTDLLTDSTHYLDIPDWSGSLLSDKSLLSNYCFNDDKPLPLDNTFNKTILQQDDDEDDDDHYQQADDNNDWIQSLVDNSDHLTMETDTSAITDVNGLNYPYSRLSMGPDLLVLRNQWINDHKPNDGKDDDDRTTSTVDMDANDSNGNISFEYNGDKDDNEVVDSTIEIEQRRQQLQHETDYSGSNYSWLIEAYYNEEEGGIYFKLHHEGGAFMKLSCNEILYCVNALITDNLDPSKKFLVKSVENRFCLVDTTKVVNVIEGILHTHHYNQKVPVISSTTHSVDGHDEADIMDDDDLSIMQEHDISFPTIFSPTSCLDFPHPATEELIEESSQKKILHVQKPTMKRKIGGAWKSITGRSKRMLGHPSTIREGIID